MSTSTSKPRRQAVVSPLLVILAIVAVIGAVRWLEERNRPLPTTTTFTVQQGQATVARADAGSDPPLVVGQSATLQSADEVHLSQGGLGQLSFAGGEMMTLYEGTHLSILDLHRKAMSRSFEASLYLDQGEMILNAPDSLRPVIFDISTRVASVATTGRVIKITVIDKTRVRVAAFEGEATVSMGDQELKLESGREVTVELGQPLTEQPASGIPPTAIPAAAPEATAEPQTEPKATLEDWEKTLFPSITTPTVPGDEYTIYTVQAGDTLSSIGRKYGLSWKVIYETNRDILSSPESIRPGQELRIPKP